ncbi:unnamed protein product [Dovyalis caffra]|uniref:Uncharacterized protein n=1 Tax=Dovyalis caffra TaxID=77055 RepID=A0AAV1S8M1_9ROSI|nr:unnamed protein product [Dovyalis caffra]
MSFLERKEKKYGRDRKIGGDHRTPKRLTILLLSQASDRTLLEHKNISGMFQSELASSKKN